MRPEVLTFTMELRVSRPPTDEPHDPERGPGWCPMLRVYLRLGSRPLSGWQVLRQRNYGGERPLGTVWVLLAERPAGKLGSWTLFPEALTGSRDGTPGLLWSDLRDLLGTLDTPEGDTAAAEAVHEVPVDALVRQLLEATAGVAGEEAALCEASAAALNKLQTQLDAALADAACLRERWVGLRASFDAVDRERDTALVRNAPLECVANAARPLVHVCGPLSGGSHTSLLAVLRSRVIALDALPRQASKAPVKARSDPVPSCVCDGCVHSMGCDHTTSGCQSRAATKSPTPLSREQLGQIVREEWVAWCHEREALTGTPAKASYVLPWERMPEEDREVDRRIGARVAAEVAWANQQKK